MDIHEEDNKILNFILDSMTKIANESLKGFSCHHNDNYKDTYDIYDKYESPHKGRVKTWSVTQNTNKENITFVFTPVYGTVSISIGYNASREFEVGYGPKNKDIKIKIMKLYYKIAAWEKVEMPRLEREEFINNAVKTFPNLLDHLILGDSSDEEKEEDS